MEWVSGEDSAKSGALLKEFVSKNNLQLGFASKSIGNSGYAVSKRELGYFCVYKNGDVALLTEKEFKSHNAEDFKIVIGGCAPSSQFNKNNYYTYGRDGDYVLIEGGKVNPLLKLRGTGNDQSNAKSAWGISRDAKTLYMVAVEGLHLSGLHEELSPGCTALELANILQRLGAWRALYMGDEGGSQLVFADSMGRAQDISLYENEEAGSFFKQTNFLGLKALRLPEGLVDSHERILTEVENNRNLKEHLERNGVAGTGEGYALCPVEGCDLTQPELKASPVHSGNKIRLKDLKNLRELGGNDRGISIAKDSQGTGWIIQGDDSSADKYMAYKLMSLIVGESKVREYRLVEGEAFKLAIREPYFEQVNKSSATGMNADDTHLRVASDMLGVYAEYSKRKTSHGSISYVSDLEEVFRFDKESFLCGYEYINGYGSGTIELENQRRSAMPFLETVLRSVIDVPENVLSRVIKEGIDELESVGHDREALDAWYGNVLKSIKERRNYLVEMLQRLGEAKHYGLNFQDKGDLEKIREYLCAKTFKEKLKFYKEVNDIDNFIKTIEQARDNGDDLDLSGFHVSQFLKEDTDIEFIKKLLDLKIVDRAANVGGKLLHAAIYEAVLLGRMDVVKELSARGVDVNEVFDDYTRLIRDVSLLATAIDKGDLEMVKVLKDLGATKVNNSYINQSYPALRYAISKDQFAIADFLNDGCDDAEVFVEKYLKYICEKDDLELIKPLIDRMKLGYCDNCHNVKNHIFTYGSKRIIEAFWDSESDKIVFLIEAISSGRRSLVLNLMEKGIKVNIAHEVDLGVMPPPYSLLVVAVIFRFTEFIQYFSDEYANFDFNEASSAAHKALIRAVQEEDAEMIRIFSLNGNISLETYQEMYRRLIHYPRSEERCIEVLNVLLAHGVRVWPEHADYLASEGKIRLADAIHSALSNEQVVVEGSVLDDSGDSRPLLSPLAIRLKSYGFNKPRLDVLLDSISEYDEETFNILEEHYGVKKNDVNVLLSLKMGIKNKDVDSILDYLKARESDLIHEAVKDAFGSDDAQNLFDGEKRKQFLDVYKESYILRKHVMLIGMTNRTGTWTQNLRNAMSKEAKATGRVVAIVDITDEIADDEELLKHFSGLINPGAGDTYPSSPNQWPFKLKDMNPNTMCGNEKIYQKVITVSSKYNIPYLGVCAGAQHLVLNNGGSLTGGTGQGRTVTLKMGSLAHFMSLSDKEKADALVECTLNDVSLLGHFAHHYAGDHTDLGEDVSMDGYTTSFSTNKPYPVAYSRKGIQFGYQFHPESGDGERNKQLLASFMGICVDHKTAMLSAYSKGISLKEAGKAFSESNIAIKKRLEECARGMLLKSGLKGFSNLVFNMDDIKVDNESHLRVWGKLGKVTIDSKKSGGEIEAILVQGGINPEDIGFYRDDGDLVIFHKKKDGEVLIIPGHFAESEFRIQGLVFTDGSVIQLSSDDTLPNHRSMDIEQLRGRFLK